MSQSSNNSAGKHASEMTDDEFESARRSRAWRDEPPSQEPAPPAAEAAAAALTSTSSGAPAPTPAAPMSRREAVLAMTDSEFNAEMKRKGYKS